MDVATIFTVIESIAVAIAAVVAILGISAWRKEFVGKRRIELAEEALALFYEAADNIRFMRSPVGFGDEGQSRTAVEGETPEQKQARTQAFVPMERYNQNKTAFIRLHALRYRFMVQFGQSSGEPFKELESIVSAIFFAAQMLAQLWAQPHRYQSSITTQRETYIKQIERNEAIFWAKASEPDEIASRLCSICNGSSVQDDHRIRHALMKRDMDLCRMILLKLEDSEQVHGFHDISVDGYSEEQVFYHVKLLHDAGLIEAIDGSSFSGLRWFAQCLTWTGHEFLDSTRNETIWNRAKARVAGELGSVPFSVVRDVVTQMARQAVGL